MIDTRTIPKGRPSTKQVAMNEWKINEMILMGTRTIPKGRPSAKQVAMNGR